MTSGAPIKVLRAALQTIHKRACGDTSRVYMSIPARPDVYADLLLSGALDELEASRQRIEELEREVDHLSKEGAEKDHELVRRQERLEAAESERDALRADLAEARKERDQARAINRRSLLGIANRVRAEEEVERLRGALKKVQAVADQLMSGVYPLPKDMVRKLWRTAEDALHSAAPSPRVEEPTYDDGIRCAHDVVSCERCLEAWSAERRRLAKPEPAEVRTEPLPNAKLATSDREYWELNDLPTHRCKVCGALWWLGHIEPIGMSWSLRSKACGPCCDNVSMGDQIEPLPPPAAPGGEAARLAALEGDCGVLAGHPRHFAAPGVAGCPAEPLAGLHFRDATGRCVRCDAQPDPDTLPTLSRRQAIAAAEQALLAAENHAEEEEWKKRTDERWFDVFRMELRHALDEINLPPPSAAREEGA